MKNTLKQIKQTIDESRGHKIIANKLKTMEYLRNGGITKKEEPKLDQLHKELDGEIHKEFGKRPEEMKESKSEEINNNIRKMFTGAKVYLKKYYNVDVGTPKIHTHTNHNGTRKYVVYPVIYTHSPDKDGQKYQTFVHHKIDSMEIKPGLPPRFDGDVRSVD